MTISTTDQLRLAQETLTDAHASGREEIVRVELATGVVIEAKWIPSIDVAHVTLYADSKPAGTAVVEHRIAISSIIAVSFTNKDVIPPKSARSYTGIIAKRILGDNAPTAELEVVCTLANHLYQPFMTASAWAASVENARQITQDEPEALPLAA